MRTIDFYRVRNTQDRQYVLIGTSLNEETREMTWLFLFTRNNIRENIDYFVERLDVIREHVANAETDRFVIRKNYENGTLTVTFNYDQCTSLGFTVNTLHLMMLDYALIQDDDVSEIHRLDGVPEDCNLTDFFAVHAGQMLASLADTARQDTRQIPATADNEVLIKSGYTTTRTYSGMGMYHSNSHSQTSYNHPVQNDKPWRIGVELELYARTQEDFNKITQARTNWFQCERDSSLTQASYSIEIKTIPLKACDATNPNFWAAPMEELKRRCKSKNYTSTGLHVHIGKEILGDTEEERAKTLDKLLYFYTYLVEDEAEPHSKNVRICGREQGYGTRIGEAKTDKGDFAKMIGFDIVTAKEDAFKELGQSLRDKTANLRGDINLHCYSTYGTIEFRKGKGIISKTRMAALCTWWQEMCLYCRETRPSEISFQGFFNRVTRHPAVNYFFQGEEEC